MRRALLLVALVAACDDKRGPPPAPGAAPATPASVASALGLDAGLLEVVDPPAPAGDLKTEIERFVNVETCVTERARIDPLLGDALRAIGYDTFLRDACRLLEAARDRRREACDKLDASALRATCQGWVAVLAQAPDQCPLATPGLAARGRAPTCVAVAARDARLCASEARAAARGTCEALVTRDEARCDPLLASDRASCRRELARWRSLLPAPLEGLPKLPVPKGRLAARGHDGTPDPPAAEIDLAAELSRGAVVVTARERARVELGSLEEPTRIAGSPNRRARFGVAIVLEPQPLKPKEARPVLDRFDLELPGEPPLACPGARCALEVATARIDKARGGEVAFKVTGTLSSGGRAYKVDLDATTFVRDVVADAPGFGRVLPPLHPAVGGVGGGAATGALGSALGRADGGR